MDTAFIVSIHYGILDLLRYLVDTQRVTLTGELSQLVVVSFILTLGAVLNIGRCVLVFKQSCPYRDAFPNQFTTLHTYVVIIISDHTSVCKRYTCLVIIISSFAATVHIEGSDVCTLSYTCSRGYTDVAKYLIMEKKMYKILGTCIVTHCMFSNQRFEHQPTPRMEKRQHLAQEQKLMEG